MNSRLSRLVRTCLVRPLHSVDTSVTWRARLFPKLAGLCAGLTLVSAQAAFQAVETFDSLTLGDINGQNGWSVSLTSGEVVLDPAGGSNQALQVSTESGTLDKAARIARGTTRMLFLRLRFEQHGSYSFGLSFSSNPKEFIDFQPELGMAAATAGDPGNDFRVANGLTTGIYDTLDTLLPDTWYNIWVLVHNDSSDSYEVWLNSDPGGDAQASDQLANSAAEILFGFRTTPVADLVNFFIKTGSGDSPIDGRFYIDDIYLEDTDATNLSNPLGDADSNNDGISDADAIALGLDPNDPDGDTDNDGFSDVDETGGGDPPDALPLDEDNDGVIDALEPGATASDASVASGLRLSSGDTVTITAAGETLSQVSAAAASGGPPTGVINFPFGSISYTTSSPLGGSAVARMAFSAELPVLLGLYKEDNGVFSELPTSTWTLVDPRTVDVTLTDGDPLTDLDGVANSSIEDPVAPAELAPLASISSGGGGGGCALDTAGQQDRDPIFPLLLLAAFGYGLRRRRNCG
jgi:hypothetical protein